MRTICVYHVADLDGHCAGAIVKLEYPDAIMVPYDYEYSVDTLLNHIPNAEPFRLIIVDFSFDPQFMAQLYKRVGVHENFIWIDHHISSIKKINVWQREWNDTPYEGLRDTYYAGCELTWKYFFPKKEIPKAVFYAGRWDVWDHADPRVVDFHYGMAAVETDPGQQDSVGLWRALIGSPEIDPQRLIDQLCKNGRLIQKYVKATNVQYMRRFSHVIEIDGLRGVAVNGSGGSPLFDCIDKEALGVSLMCCYVYLQNMRWRVTLYSDDPDIDCSRVAEKFGGGGHKGAAGFVTSTPTLPFTLLGPVGDDFIG